MSILQREKGQNLVEFALILPFFLLLVLGMVEFGRGWMTRNILTGAARDGARVAAVQLNLGQSQAQGISRVNALLMPTGITPDSVVVDDPGGVIPSIRVIVTFSYPVFILNFIPGLGPSVALTGEATMRRERY